MISIDWTARWDALRSACGKHSATNHWLQDRTQPPRFEISPPAQSTELQAVQRELACAVPTAFAGVLLEYSAAIDVAWQLPADHQPPPPLDQIFSGECRWNLHELPELQRKHREWIDGCFDDPDDEYDRVWHNKLAFAEVGNGDMLAIEMGEGDRQPVIYLSHDDGEGHGYSLGSDFRDFLDRFTKLGCPGYEAWQWLPFVEGPQTYLDPQSAEAVEWQKWFGIEPESDA